MNNPITAKLASGATGVLVSAMLALASSNALAKDEMTMDHGKIDLNKDGMVTESEIVNYVEMHFLTMDRNRDHMIDTSEWADYWEY